ncbi:MAG TPA: glycosyltransferase family 4 protein [Bacteroidales bacterium]|nr:glycosyltransferase family 4 protein [Bacteroidales bacterium]HPJ60196.1 glycosyltransferase family 4 protein [Bacteroidales bacterium]
MHDKVCTPMVRRKLCLVIPSLQAGGMERVMSELATYLYGHDDLEIHLVLYGKRPEIFYQIPDGIRVHKPLSGFNNRYRFYYSVSRLVFLRKAVARINPDSVLSFGEYWNSFVLLALFGLSCPVYISDRCSPASEPHGIHKILRRWLYPGAKGVIAQTALARKMYKEQFRHENISVIGNPIRFPEQTSVSRQKRVLTIGRLIRSKNHDEIIRMFCRIDKPGWNLVIVGGDALKQGNEEILRGIVKSLDAESKVELAGYRKNTDNYYYESSLFVLASESEGFPNVIGEAMAAGLPVVAFDCIAGPSEMITDGVNGFLVPVGDYDQMASRIELLMDDDDLRSTMGSRAREAIERFRLDVIGNEYYNFLLGA